jgi:K+-sensing histidine kinase KdpD
MRSARAFKLESGIALRRPTSQRLRGDAPGEATHDRRRPGAACREGIRLSLINDILDLPKIEAGRMEREPSKFDLPDTIEKSLTLVRERAIRRRISLERSVDERLGTIGADERKVKQVPLNLLSNALKFTPEGGMIVVRSTASDGVAEISVTDAFTLPMR